MQVTCLTIRAAAEVVHLLLGAGLRPAGAFRMTDPHPFEAPIHFTISAPIAAYLVEQVRAIPDTTIVESAA